MSAKWLRNREKDCVDWALTSVADVVAKINCYIMLTFTDELTLLSLFQVLSVDT